MSDYFYGSARVRALEKGLLNKDALERLLETSTIEQAYFMLEEQGFSLQTDANGKILREETLLTRLSSAYAEITQLTEEIGEGLFSIWRYPYDCNNLKAVIKCFIRGISCEGMTFDFGTVSVEEIKKMVRMQDYSALPTNLSSAATEAMATYAKTKDPQRIDLILDRACFADMLDAAEKSGVSYTVKLVKTKIDLTNLVMCLRVMRMQSGDAGKILLRDALLDGGTLETDRILDLYEMEEKSFWEKLLYTDYRKFAEALSSKHPSLTEVERAADNVFMDVAREARFIACGPEVLIGYLLGVENEVRNIRVLLAGKATGLPRETVWERIRESYV